MRVERGGVYAVVASLGGAPKNPVWYYNLKKNPHVELQDRAGQTRLHAREVTGDEKAVWWKRAVEAWPDYANYQAKTERRSRCSCSNRWSRGRFLPSPRLPAAPTLKPRLPRSRAATLRASGGASAGASSYDERILLGLPLDRIDETPDSALVRRVENGRRRKRGLLRASPHEEPVVEYLQRQGHSSETARVRPGAPRQVEKLSRRNRWHPTQSALRSR